jgi:hypothetical protein
MSYDQLLPGGIKSRLGLLMSVRRPLSLLAALVLLSPLAAVAVPGCAPGQHCPMAGAVGDGPPCHGTAIQADNCCLTAATAEVVEVAPVIALTAPAIDNGGQAPDALRADAISPGAPDNTPSPPLYRLFRALLI